MNYDETENKCTSGVLSDRVEISGLCIDANERCKLHCHGRLMKRVEGLSNIILVEFAQ